MAVSEFEGTFDMVLLWTNPNPAAEFGWQAVLSAPSYRAVEIEFCLWRGDTALCTTDKCDKGRTSISTAVASSADYAIGSQICPVARRAYFRDDGVVGFENGMQANFASGGTWQTANGVMIPYRIYGIT